MKIFPYHYKFQIQLIIILISIIITSAIEPNQLEGSWKVDFIRSIEGTEIQKKDKFNSLSEERKELIRKAFENRYFIFDRNEKVQIIYEIKNKVNQVNGIYKYDKKNRLLQITANRITRTYTVHWENSAKILLSLNETSENSLFDSFYLIKN